MNAFLAEDFEVDFATAVEMFLGASYKEAVAKARAGYFEEKAMLAKKEEARCRELCAMYLREYAADLLARYSIQPKDDSHD